MNIPNKIEILDKKFEILFTNEIVNNRIVELANKINFDYSNSTPMFIIVLKGGMFFATELLKNISLNCEIEALISKSYGLKMKSSGVVDLIIGSVDLENKDIIILEDIIDTGLTMNKLINVLNSYGPKSIKVASLLRKPKCAKVEVKVDYVGFDIDDKFVVGYGLDYAEYGRQLPAIYQLSEN